MFNLQMKDKINLCQKYFLMLLNYHKDKINDRKFDLSKRAWITLLNKNKLNFNKENNSFPDYSYLYEDRQKVLGESTEIELDLIEDARRKAIEIANYQYEENKEEFEIIDKDFQMHCSNPCVFLIIMSMLRKCNSIKCKILPLIITSKEFYYLLDFDQPKIKFLQIGSYFSPFYPVNFFHEDSWFYEEEFDDEYEIYKSSLSAYAIFKFLVNSNFIYSLEELRIICTSSKDKFEEILNKLILEFKRLSSKAITLKVCYSSPNIQILNLKEYLKYFEYFSSNTNSYYKQYDIIFNSKEADTVSTKQLKHLIYQSVTEEKCYTSKIHRLLSELLSKIDFKYDFNLRPFIDECYHSVAFDYYNDVLYDCEFILYGRKIEYIESIVKRKHETKDYVRDYTLQEECKTSILGGTLVEGTKVKRHTFTNCYNFDTIHSKKMLKINISSKTLTIFCKNISEKLITLEYLGRLWPDLILILDDFCCSQREGINSLLKLVVNGDGTAKQCKLLFSKIMFTNIHFDLFLESNFKSSKPFLEALKEKYSLYSDDERFNALINNHSLELKIDKVSILEKEESKSHQSLSYEFPDIISLKSNLLEDSDLDKKNQVDMDKSSL